MSEIKGQLLGMVLVLAIFSAISGILVKSFTKKANDIATEINSTSISVSEE